MEYGVGNTQCSPEANEECANAPGKVFETLWAMYPLKRGKGRVSEANKMRILDIGLDEMTRVIERYKADLAKETWRIPQNGSTFFNGGYVDYLDANYSPPPEQRREIRKNGFSNFPQRDWDFDEMERMEQERRDKAHEQSGINGQADS